MKRQFRSPLRGSPARTGVAVLVIATVIALAWVGVSRSRKPDRAASDGGTMGGMQSNSGSVVLSASQLRQFGVTFDTVRLRTLESEVRAAGTITFDETRIAQITPKFAGYVERLFVNATGQTVSRGQPVAAVYSADLVAAQSELLLAARLDRSIGQNSVPGAQSAPTLLAAARQRLRLWDISDAQIDNILRTGRAQRTLTLFSPVSGIVVEKNVVQGQSVMPGAQLMTIADLSTIWVVVELREADAGSVRPGTSATVELNAFPGQRIAGRVSYVYPTLQADARTIKARIPLANPSGRVKPGMYATVRLTSPMITALALPASAIVQTGDRSYVFVDEGGGRLMPHDVRLGRKGGDYIEVLSGVSAGQRVVTSAQFLLDSESNLGEVMRSMIQQGGSSGGPGGKMNGMTMPPNETGSTTDKGADMKGMKMPSATRR